MTVVDIAYRLK